MKAFKKTLFLISSFVIFSLYSVEVGQLSGELQGLTEQLENLSESLAAITPAPTPEEHIEVPILLEKKTRVFEKAITQDLMNKVIEEVNQINQNKPKVSLKFYTDSANVPQSKLALFPVLTSGDAYVADLPSDGIDEMQANKKIVLVFRERQDKESAEESAKEMKASRTYAITKPFFIIYRTDIDNFIFEISSNTEEIGELAAAIKKALS